MSKNIKRGISSILLITTVFIFSFFVVNKDMPKEIFASVNTTFENKYDYDFKNISELDDSIISYVSIDELYDIVIAVSDNVRFRGYLDMVASEVTNAKIIEYIRVFNPSYTPVVGDWVVAYSSGTTPIEYRYVYNQSGNWEQKISNEDTNIANAIDNKVGDKLVAIRNADDLFRLGNMASINFDRQGSTNSYIYTNTIKKILSLNYVLLDDIDYSTKRAQRFVPLGININIDLGFESKIEHYMPFTGTFDGQGFKISNLYLADYGYISTTFQDSDASTAITGGLFSHYSMFSAIGNTGVVKNFVLDNPSYDLIVGNELAGLYKTSMLAGLNRGTIYNVGVIDNKRTQVGADNSGINFAIPYASINRYNAAGFVYDNEGFVYNSFLATPKVLSSGSSDNRFDQIAAFYGTNSGTMLGVSYLETVSGLKYPTIDVNDPNYDPLAPVENEDINKYSQNQYYSGSGINLNDWDQYPNDEHFKGWHFYSEDGYPTVHFLEYNSDHYKINDERDLIIFSKLLNKTTPKNGKTLNMHVFKLTKDLNMVNYSNFKTIGREFSGTLTSEGDTKYIYNLNLNNPFIIGSEYYLGLFARVGLTGNINNINFLENSLLVTNSNSHYGKTFYVGTIAGRLNGGTINNVYVNSNINLGTNALGTTYVGGLVGYGFGSITNSGNVKKDDFGLINGNTHNFNNYNIIPKFYIGGLVGANSNNIHIKNSFNEVNISGVSSQGTNFNSTLKPETFTGGIIGEITNHTNNGSSLNYVTNYGTVEAGYMLGNNLNPASAFVGGIFGSLRGFGFKLNEGSQVFNGRLENNGIIKGKYNNEYTTLYAAGIGVANTTETLANISYMINKNGYEFTGFNHQTNNKTIFYASTIVDNSNGGITLSRAYNTAHYSLNQTFFDNTAGLTSPADIEIAFFYTKVNKNVTQKPSKLMYVENSGNLTVGSTTGEVNFAARLKISNITQSTRVYYYNVINSGNINVLNLNNNRTNADNSTANSIYVAGVTWILPYDNQNYLDNSPAYLMENVLNEGNIYTAGIRSNTLFNGNVTGEVFNDSRNFNGDLSVKNLYVAGIVNLNVGIISNSFNIGTISSEYTSDLKDIMGSANTFVGGINTFNYNVIRDSANSGLINYTNSNNSQANYAYFSANTSIGTDNNSIFGGMSIVYNGGVVVAGISAGLGHVSGTELDGHRTGLNTTIEENSHTAEVVDTINNGDIFGKARYYVRSGGILGIALGVELSAGTYRNNSETNNAGPFTTTVIGSGDPIRNSLLSNGLNYGNVYAVSEFIGYYGPNYGTGIGNSDANAIRPGINSAAGGVIAYGLTTMVRMVNHGMVAASDVAGGIVGSTYILGAVDQGSTIITDVNINTAVHYGRVRSIKFGTYNSNRRYVADSRYNNFNYSENDSPYDNTRFYQESEYNQHVYYKANQSTRNIEHYQLGRRGFGGIFGRLQRGNFGTMRALDFKNIMNMDDEIDFVGRVDSNQPGSLVYYRFFDTTKGETYYSIKEDDMSPYAFVGWNTDISEYISFDNVESVTFRIERRTTWLTTRYHVLSITTNSNGVLLDRTRTKTVKLTTSTNTSRQSVTIADPTRKNVTGTVFSTSRSNNFLHTTFGLGSSHIQGFNSDGTQEITVYNYSFGQVLINSISSGSTSNPPSNNALRFPVNKISEVQQNDYSHHIFDSEFSLMQSENSDFIYAVEVDALAKRFRPAESGQPENQNAKPNGMYVLASSTGSVDGNALPSNINITNLYRLSENENSANFIDLNNVTINNLVEPNELDPNSLLNKYNDMYQLEYNDKSEVLSEDESISPLISELVLKDPNGISPTLLGGVIDRSGLIPTITFNLSNTAFEGTNNSLYYEIDYNLLSTNAIVGSRGLNASDNYRLNADQYAALVYAYNNSENNIIENGALTNYQGESVGDWEPHFSIEVNGFTSGSRTFPMRIYSEAYLKDNSIYEQDKYFKDYHIIIQREPTIISTNATVTLDNVSRTETNIPVNYSFPTTGANSATMPPSGSIKSLFVGTNATINGLIKPGHEINFISLTHQVQGTTQTVLVDSSFYQVELIKKGSVSGNSNQFGFEITLSDELEAGVYIANYSYFESSNNRTIEFTKRESSDYNITNLDYEFYSKDDENTDFSFEQTNANFTTYIEFGYELASLTRGVPVNLTIELNEKANKDEFNYDYDITHYDLKLGDDVIISNLRISPFSKLNSAIISYDYEDGLRVYKITYHIDPESGESVNIVHTIKERTISDINFYVNDNLQALNEFSVTREDILSRIDVDFKFNNEELYNFVTMKVDNINHTDNDEIYLIDNEGIFSYGITYLQQPGLKTYEFILNREGDPNINYSLGTANITKSLGVSAYLIDVKYEGLDGGAIFKYPTIDVADSDGNVIDNDNPNYDTRFYAGGIDYLELQGVERYFRINSEVSDIDLEFYVPGFVLPYGATIKRFDKTINDWTTATIDVNDDSLKTDYIGFEDAVEVVRYRVIPEDGNEDNFVDYYISAVDLNYNLTLRFNIYYNDPTHGIILANDINSPIKDNVLLISLKQMKIELTPTTSNSLLEVLPTNDGLVNAFPSVLLKNDLRASFNGINNQSTLFYYLSSEQKTYRFGRNQTGAYNFTIKTPRYTIPSGETDNLNDNLTPNERYKYDIYTSARGATISEWYVENRKLPRMDDYIDGNAGLFYYVYFPSTNPINRELSIVINPETVDQKWGLYDDYGSFDQQTT